MACTVPQYSNQLQHLGLPARLHMPGTEIMAVYQMLMKLELYWHTKTHTIEDRKRGGRWGER
jgi:hypothetical protein